MELLPCAVEPGEESAPAAAFSPEPRSRPSTQPSQESTVRDSAHPIVADGAPKRSSLLPVPKVRGSTPHEHEADGAPKRSSLLSVPEVRSSTPHETAQNCNATIAQPLKSPSWANSGTWTFRQSEYSKNGHSRPSFSSSSRALKLVTETAGAVAQVVKRQKTMYTNEVASEIERTIYDIEYYTDSKGLLKDDGIIIFEGSPSPGLLRAFTDRRVRIIDTLFICSVCATCVVAPFTFMFNGTWRDPSRVPGQRATLIFDLLLDVFFAFYLLWQLNVSILDTESHCEVVSRTHVIRRRIHSKFYWIQWVSVTPYVFVFFGVNLRINAMKLVRLAYIFELPDSFWEMKESIGYRVGRIIAMLLFASHWSACLLVNVGGYREAAERQGFDYFETQLEGSTIAGSFSLYIMAFVEAIYMLTGSLDNPLGDGSARDKQFGSLLIVASFSPIGCVVMSLFIASICRENNLWGVLDMKHEENKAFMNRALQSLNIPYQLRQRVFKLYHFQRMGHDREAFEALFNRKNLSPALESALKIYIYNDNVMASPYFFGKDTNYVLEVIRVLEDRVFLPGDFVIRRGEVGTKMYFIVRGELSVLVPDPKKHRKTISSSTVVKQLCKGEYFGEVALTNNSVRTAWVRADAYVLLATLSREDVQKIWLHFPKECDVLVDMAASLRKQDQERVIQARKNSEGSDEFDLNSEFDEDQREIGMRRQTTDSNVVGDVAPMEHEPTDSGPVTNVLLHPPRVVLSHAQTETENSEERCQSTVKRPRTGGGYEDWRSQLLPQITLRDTSRAEDVMPEAERMMSDPSAQSMLQKLSELTQCQSAMLKSQGELQQQVAACLERISSMEQALIIKSVNMVEGVSTPRKSLGQSRAQHCWQAPVASSLPALSHRPWTSGTCGGSSISSVSIPETPPAAGTEATPNASSLPKTRLA